jgi:hypothetical protein
MCNPALMLNFGGVAMSEIHESAFQGGNADRQMKCRAETEKAMHELFAAVARSGYLDIEVAMALADAAEDYVIDLARSRMTRSRRPH